MAPEPGILKRVRNKPAEWWAAPPAGADTGTAKASPSLKERDRPLSVGDRAANKGKSAIRGGKGNGEDEENRDPGSVKPTRRGRSSAGEKELKSINAAAKSAIDTKDKRKKSANSTQPVLEQGRIEELPKPVKPRKTHRVADDEEGDGRDILAEGSVDSNRQGRRALQASAREGDAVRRKGEQSTLPKSTNAQSSANEAPRRRGRSSNTEAELQPVNYKETATRNQSRRDIETELPTSIVEKSMKTHQLQRRGRSSNTEAELRAPVNYKETRTLKRASLPDAEANLQSSETIGSRSKPRHGRGRQSSPSRIEVQSSQAVVTGKGYAKKSSRRDSQVQMASSNFSKSRTKSTATVRPTAKGKVDKGTFSTATHSENSRKGRNLGAVAARNVAPEQVDDSSQMSESRNKRKTRNPAEDPASEPPAPKRQRSEKSIEDTQLKQVPNYQHLAAVTRKVSRATIDSSWEPLPTPCVDRVSQFLQDMQRPVVVRLGDERKRNQASTALQMISRRLVNKISRGIPFPKSTRSNREDDFDFEKILDHNRALESQLTPALHSNELLEAELVKEKALLEAEEAFLNELEGNAKAESVKRKHDARKLHPLLQASPTEENDPEDDIGLNTYNQSRVNVNLLQDENLQAVVRLLQGHVDSIGGNLLQVQGITEAMAKSKAAVQATLFGCLDSAQYEDVVLG